jgi:hypothetical protein
MERIALGLRTREGIATDTIAINRTHALSRAGLLRHDTDRIVLTPAENYWPTPSPKSCCSLAVAGRDSCSGGL